LLRPHHSLRLLLLLLLLLLDGPLREQQRRLRGLELLAVLDLLDELSLEAARLPLEHLVDHVHARLPASVGNICEVVGHSAEPSLLISSRQDRCDRQRGPSL